MELGPQNQSRDGFFGGPNSIVRVYGPSGFYIREPLSLKSRFRDWEVEGLVYRVQVFRVYIGFRV